MSRYSGLGGWRGSRLGRAEGRAGRAAGRRAGRRWAQAACVGWQGRAEHRRVDAQGAQQGAAGRGRRAAWALGARPMRTGWASWVLVHPSWFLTWFFDSVFFLSHQMNTVHYKINFGKKIF